uniref:Cell division cycle 20.2, cofactor of APC complex-like n=1 Tax=Dermatophagoides pteronyssinus TaxID=6956 RepID=A0A6P6Y7F1_DERPT|nr:cell division cycle 20.2, cofactor of APC complex-like [Dermatophagoides pteronyssinus]
MGGKSTYNRQQMLLVLLAQYVLIDELGRGTSIEDGLLFAKSILQHLISLCKFSPDGNYLAVGTATGVVEIWDLNHTAAVKAVAWAPLNYPLLATGGGTNDRTIKLWDIPRRSCITSCESESQVCNLMWSKKSFELVSTHGYTLNQVNLS